MTTILKIEVNDYDPIKNAREASWNLHWRGQLYGNPVIYTGKEDDDVVEYIFEMLVDNFNYSFKVIKEKK